MTENQKFSSRRVGGLSFAIAPGRGVTPRKSWGITAPVDSMYWAEFLINITKDKSAVFIRTWLFGQNFFIKPIDFKAWNFKI